MENYKWDLIFNAFIDIVKEINNKILNTERIK